MKKDGTKTKPTLKHKIATDLIHAGEIKPYILGAISFPIFQTSTFEMDDTDEIKYTRLNNNPNQNVLHTKLALLENTEAALVTASGMAAISATLMAVLKTGDHLIAQESLYGGTHGFITEDFKSLGIEFDLVNPTDVQNIKKKIKSNTKAIYLESLSNPNLKFCDFETVVALAKKHKLTTIIDNTFTPLHFRPSDWGIDIVVHSATKYLNGHSDIIAGAVMSNTAWIKKIGAKLKFLGGSLDPHACFLLHRGLKTLSLRMQQHQESTNKIAQFLNEHPAIDTVYYPGLKTHPDFALGKKYFKGFGGVLSFTFKGGTKKAEQLIKKMKLAAHAPSLGGVETLITRPITASHKMLSAKDKAATGIRDDLIRLCVGIEDTDDLINDIAQALGDK